MFIKDPAGKLERVLERLEWERVADRFDLETSHWHRAEPGLWEKWPSRLLVDNVGIFFYRLKDSRWVRTHGLAHDLISPRTHEIVFIDGSRLDLETGEWHGMDGSIS